MKSIPHSSSLMRAQITLAVLLAAAVSLNAQSTQTRQLRELSLQECIAIAIQDNFTVQISRFNPEISRLNLSSSYGAYDPVFSASGEHNYNLSSGGVDQQGRTFSGTETDSDTVAAGLGGFLPWGLSYNLGGSVTDQYGTRPGSTVDTGSFTLQTNQIVGPDGTPTGDFLLSTNYSTVATRSPFDSASGRVGVLTLQQPLLKNFWIDSTRLNISLFKNEVKGSDIDFRNQLMDTVRLVEVAYFDLISAQETVLVQEKALELAERLLAENKKRVEVGALAPLEEKQAEAEVEASRANLLSARATRDTVERVLKNVLSDNYVTNWLNVSIVPKDRLLAIPQQYDLQESWRRGLERNPRYAIEQAKLVVENNDLRVRYRRNQLYPQLDLIGSVGYSGSSDEFSGALGQMADRDNPSWSFGAQISVPLSRTSERNNLKSAKAIKEQSVLQLKQQEQRILIQIENDIANAQSNLQRVEATRQARLYREAALDAEQRKLENGKSTSFIVLQLQRDLTEARSAEIEALADYNKSLAELAYDEGASLERHQIDISTK